MITRHRGSCRFIFLLICLLSVSAFARTCPVGDLDENCRVDLDDVALFVDQWLLLNPEMCDEGGYCADFNAPEGIDFIDFSTLAYNWMAYGALPLYINEFMASNNNDSGITDPYGDYDDWIEIYNAGDSPIDLAGFYFTDDLANPTKWQIPSGYSSQTTIPADGFVIIWADDEAAEGPLHAPFKLSGTGEELGLFDTDGSTLIDYIVFGAQATNISYGRYPETTDNWRFFPTPTPGSDNNGAYFGIIEDVELSHKRGFYSSSSPFNLTMATVTPDVVIYYTTDGRSPIVGETHAPTSIEYTSPITINSTKIIRAAAVKTGWMPTKVETYSFIFDANSYHKAIPIMAIVGDPTETLWDPNGVMSSSHRGFGYEKPASLELFDANSVYDYQIDCGLRIHGNARYQYTIGNDWLTCWTNWWDNQNMNKFSFRFYFRTEYGNNRFEYPFFTFTPEVLRQQCIVLRGGKNDSCTPFVKDEFWRRVFKQMGGIQLTGRLVNLYINGVYKAYFNPCGRDNAQFFKEFYGSNNEFDVITSGGLRDGDSNSWNSLLSYISNNDLTIAANYDYVASKFDIPNYIDYLIVQIHSGNFDWPNNNWTVHSEKTENGVFRFSLWDAEGTEMWYFKDNCLYCADTGFDHFPSYGNTPKGLNGSVDWPISKIYRALKANPNFRQLFADRIHKYYRNNGLMTTANLLTMWNDTVNEVKPVLPAYDGALPPSFVGTVFLPNRESKVLAAFADNSLWNLAQEAPSFNINGAYQYGGYFSAGSSLTMTDPCSAGAIYYTTDGNDPRLPAQGAIVGVWANKKVLVPSSDIGTTWRGANEPYNDSAWTSGTGGVGYERDQDVPNFNLTYGYRPYFDVNVRPIMYNIRKSCYVRIPFTVDACDLVDVCSLALKTRYDDGFVAFLNGTEIARRNAPTTLLWNSGATANIESTSNEEIDITSYLGNLHSGSNILAIHALNYNQTSSDPDFLIRAELELVNKGGVNPNAQLYTGAVTLNQTAKVNARTYKSSTKKWSALNEAVYTLTNVASNLRITELMYNPKDTGEPNDEDSEYIELKNIGGSTINLNLVSFDKGITFTFGPNSLAAGQYILAVKDINAFTTKYGTGRPVAGQYIGSLNNGGERIRLLDAVGTTIQDFNYKDGWRSIADGNGYSLTLINPANADLNSWNYNGSWRASAYIEGSPGWDDSGIIPNPGAITLNEIMAHSHDVAPDWIELRNTTASAINIGGWFLSNSDSELMKYRFATGTTIPANGYIVVREDVNFGDTAGDPGKLIPFALSENGDFVRLTSALDANSNLTGYREKEDFGASETGVSFGRYYKASTDSYNFVPMEANTPGYANAYPRVGPIVITEIFYNPDWPNNGNFANDEYEFIELRNISGSPVTLYDFTENLPWKFTDGIDYTFPSTPDEAIIPAGGRILVVKNPVAFSWRYPSVPTNIIYGPYDGWLANEGEQLELGKPGDVDELGVRHYIRVERINYSDGSHPGNDPTDPWPTDADGLGKSLKRTSDSLYGNDPNNWTAATPTPGT